MNTSRSPWVEQKKLAIVLHSLQGICLSNELCSMHAFLREMCCRCCNQQEALLHTIIPLDALRFVFSSPKKRKERFELKQTARNKRFLLQTALWENVLIRVCVLCYKLFEGDNTPCGSLVSPQIRVRVNAHFVTQNAHFARVNAHFVRVNAYFGWPLKAFFCVCNTKRSIPLFKSRQVCI